MILHGYADIITRTNPFPDVREDARADNQCVVRRGSAGTHPITADVRAIPATSRSLADLALAAGHFRDNPCYRPGVLPNRIPPLHGRTPDIPRSWSISCGRRRARQGSTSRPPRRPRPSSGAWTANGRATSTSRAASSRAPRPAPGASLSPLRRRRTAAPAAPRRYFRAAQRKLSGACAQSRFVTDCRSAPFGVIRLSAPPCAV